MAAPDAVGLSVDDGVLKGEPEAETFGSEDDDGDGGNAHQKPDAVVEIPSKALASVIGTGGSIIRAIEKRSRAKVMVVKEEKEKGTATAAAATTKATAAAAAAAAGTKKPSSAFIHLFGSAGACSEATKMIEEAVAAGSKRAREQREQQQKGSDGDASAAAAASRERHILLLRHAGDFRALGLSAETCSSAAEVRSAFRGLARRWHPDKCKAAGKEREGAAASGNGGGEGGGGTAAVSSSAAAAAKFREIQAAYEALVEVSGMLFA